MIKQKRLLVALTLSALCCSNVAYADTEKKLEGCSERVFPQKGHPVNIVNHNGAIYAICNNQVVNLSGGEVSPSLPMNYVLLSLDPSSETYAFLKGKGTSSKVVLRDLWQVNMKTAVRSKAGFTSCCFADNSILCLCEADSKMTFYKLTRIGKNILAQPNGEISLPFTPYLSTARGTLAVVANGTDVALVNVEKGVVVNHLTAEGEVKSIDLSSDCRFFAVLTSDGTLSTYDTADASFMEAYHSLGEGRSVSIHPNCKYASVVVGDMQIAVVNLLDDSQRRTLDMQDGGVTQNVFIGSDDVSLVYNTQNSIRITKFDGIDAPYMGKILEEEVMSLMAEWEKKMPMESDYAYRARVNEDSRAAQMRMFEEQVATRMASEYMTEPEMAFSSYNPQSGKMTLDFDSMPTIYIDVPKEDLASFSNASDLELRNPIYGVNGKDNFELLYAEVYNKQSGKSYTFNNRERKDLEYLSTDEGFIPINYVKQSNVEEKKLGALKDDVVAKAKKAKSISDHTKINVSTNTYSNTDADGKRHFNYKVSFGYSVDAAFSAKEDFAPGVYATKESAAARSMLAIIQQALKTDFAQYVREGKKVKVIITGTADAAAIRKTIPYNGEYGNFGNEPVYDKDGNLKFVSVNTKDGITSNDQLAFLRAQGVKRDICDNVLELSKMESSYEIHILQTEGVGGQYRRIYVDFEFVDAF